VFVLFMQSMQATAMEWKMVLEALEALASATLPSFCTLALIFRRNIGHLEGRHALVQEQCDANGEENDDGDCADKEGGGLIPLRKKPASTSWQFFLCALAGPLLLGCTTSSFTVHGVSDTLKMLSCSTPARENLCPSTWGAPASVRLLWISLKAK